MELPGYYWLLIRSHHPSNTKWGREGGGGFVCTTKIVFPEELLILVICRKAYILRLKWATKFVMLLLFIGLYKPISGSELLSIKFKMRHKTSHRKIFFNLSTG